VLNDIAK
jgi:hypothetical protein